jgi:hypothetical protein
MFFLALKNLFLTLLLIVHSDSHQHVETPPCTYQFPVFFVAFINVIYDTKVFFRHEFDPIELDVISSLAKLVIHFFGTFHATFLCIICQALTRMYSLTTLIDALFFHV